MKFLARLLLAIALLTPQYASGLTPAQKIILLSGAGEVLTGGETLLAGETSGFAADFTDVANPNEQVLVRRSTLTYGADEFLTNGGTSPKLVKNASAGLEWAAHNIILQSQTFSDAAWNKVKSTATAGSATAPNGTATGFLIADSNTDNDNHGLTITSAVTAIAGATYTYSIYAKKRDYRYVQVNLYTGTNRYGFFDLDTGATSGITNADSLSTEDVGNGWWRLKVVATLGAAETTVTPHAYYTDTTVTAAHVGVVGTGTYFWGAQVNRGTLATAYLPTTSAARYGVAREHDGTQWQALVEPAGTNLALRAWDYANAAWNVFGAGAAKVGVGVTDPFGGTNSYELTLGTVGGAFDSASAVYQNITMPTTTTYTASFYLRSKTGTTTVRIGANVNGAASVDSGDITLTTTWQRFTVSGSGTATANGNISIRTNVAGNSTAIYASLAQLETGTVATSPIPTFAATVTRAADAPFVLTSAIPFFGSAHTLFAQFTKRTAAVRGVAASLSNPSDGSADDISVDGQNDGQLRAYVETGGALEFGALTMGAYTANTSQRMAIAAATNSANAAANGTIAGADDTSVTLPVPTRLTIGNIEATTGGATQPLNGYVSSVAYIARRATNTELVNLTNGTTAPSALLSSETTALVIDFSNYDAPVSLKLGVPEVSYAPDAFFSNGGTSPKLVYDSTGTLVWSPHNLVLQSETLSSWLAVVGTPIRTATTVEDNDAAGFEGVWQGFTGILNETYTVTYWVGKDSVTTRFPEFQLDIGSGGAHYVTLNTQTGATGYRSGTSLPAGGAVSVADEGDRWRLSITSGPAGSTSLNAYIYPALTTSMGGALDNAAVGTVTVYKTQFNRGRVPTAYLATTTAQRMGLALDYNPTTLAARGLLVEPAATNLITQSRNASTPVVLNSNTTVTANTQNGPDGTLIADTLTIGADGYHYKQSEVLVASTVYTGSIYVRASAPLTVNMRLIPGVGTAVQSAISVSTAWQRFTLTGTSGGDTTRAELGFDVRAVSGGDGVAKTIFVSDFQLEAGSVATSPIPTFAATVTRAADNPFVLTSAIPYSLAAETIFAQFVPRVLSVNRSVMALSDGSASNGVTLLAQQGTNLYGVVSSGGGNSFLPTPPSQQLTLNAVNKMALAATVNDFALVANASSPIVDAAGAMPVSLTTLQIGNHDGTALETLNGWVEKTFALPRRATNAELQTRTQ